MCRNGIVGLGRTSHTGGDFLWRSSSSGADDYEDAGKVFKEEELERPALVSENCKTVQDLFGFEVSMRHTNEDSANVSS